MLYYVSPSLRSNMIKKKIILLSKRYCRYTLHWSLCVCLFLCVCFKACEKLHSEKNLNHHVLEKREIISKFFQQSTNKSKFSNRYHFCLHFKAVTTNKWLTSLIKQTQKVNLFVGRASSNAVCKN